MKTSIARLGAALVSVVCFFHSAAAQAAWEVNMTRGVTDVSQKIYDLHMTIFWICVAIGVVVFGVMFWSILHHRKSQGAKPAQFHESIGVEIAWTVVPLLILIGMAIPATATLIEMYDASDAEIDVKITGYQWKWQYDYLGEDISFFSNLSTPKDEIYNRVAKNENYLLEVDEPLVLPINKKVRFLITANDVIHAWWVPELAVKKDAIPGFINESWTNINEPGIYRGQCAELCGKDHGFMPIVVKAVTEPEYNEWLLAKKEEARQEFELKNKDWSLDELMARGESVYEKNCANCHQSNGEGVSGAFPALKASVMALNPDPADHIDIVLNGSKTNPLMAAFGPQLSEVDLAAVITYERNAWGNNVGDKVTPQDIVKAKGQ